MSREEILSILNPYLKLELWVVEFMRKPKIFRDHISQVFYGAGSSHLGDQLAHSLLTLTLTHIALGSRSRILVEGLSAFTVCCC